MIQGCRSNIADKRIEGTFIQLLDAHNDWSVNEWEDFFDILRRLGVKHIVLQWTELEQSRHVHPNSPAISTIMRLAQRSAMAVTLGLASSSKYWEHVSTDIDDRRRYLNAALQRSITTAQMLSANAQQHASFAGWYITEEIDADNWNTAAAREVLTTYVTALAAQLHVLTPKAKVAISGFGNGTTAIATVRSLWADLFAAGIDIVMFQDGVGAGKLSIEQVAKYFTAIDDTAILQGKALWPVVELFEQTPSASSQPVPFSASAAAPERVCRQLSVASAHGHHVIAFSIPDYMWPTGAAKRQNLYHRYLDNLCSAK